VSPRTIVRCHRRATLTALIRPQSGGSSTLTESQNDGPRRSALGKRREAWIALARGTIASRVRQGLSKHRSAPRKRCCGRLHVARSRREVALVALSVRIGSPPRRSSSRGGTRLEYFSLGTSPCVSPSSSVSVSPGGPSMSRPVERQRRRRPRLFRWTTPPPAPKGRGPLLTPITLDIRPPPTPSTPPSSAAAAANTHQVESTMMSTTTRCRSRARPPLVALLFVSLVMVYLLAAPSPAAAAGSGKCEQGSTFLEGKENCIGSLQGSNNTYSFCWCGVTMGSDAVGTWRDWNRCARPGCSEAQSSSQDPFYCDITCNEQPTECCSSSDPQASETWFPVEVPLGGPVGPHLLTYPSTHPPIDSPTQPPTQPTTLSPTVLVS